MKNILISVFTIALLVFVIILMAKGISFGRTQILSIPQIIQENDELNKKVEELNTLNNVDYKKNISNLNQAIKTLSKSKTEYLDKASLSTEEEIKEASQKKVYAREYLWSQIGNHATSEGVNLKVEVASSGTTAETYSINRLTFTVNGSYVAIRNFVYSLENDTDLNFRIENFALTGSGENLTATFIVNEISIKIENSSSNVLITTTQETTTKDANENRIDTRTDVATQRIDAAVNGTNTVNETNTVN